MDADELSIQSWENEGGALEACEEEFEGHSTNHDHLTMQSAGASQEFGLMSLDMSKRARR
jgi:hypothetical protein